MKLDIKVGDTVLGGKWRNKKIEVKEIGKDDLGQPTINGKPMLKFRIPKLMPKKVTESKMNHLKIYEDFGQDFGQQTNDQILDPQVGEIANSYLGKILRDEMKFDLIDPRNGEFNSDFDDTDGSTQSELTWGFKDPHGHDSHIAIDLTWSWTIEKSKFSGTREQPPDPDETVLTGIELNKVNYYNDAEKDGDFEINPENKKLLQQYLEQNLPVDKIKNFRI